MKKNEILLVSDFVGVGKVALSAMIPILSTMEARLNYLPTALVSNNFGYGEAVVKDLTDYMKDSKEMWDKHDFNFDLIATGIMLNVDQVAIVRDIIDKHDKKPFVVVDPIMGDGGQVYPGLSKDMVKAYREMIGLADLLVPNFTELSLLLEEDYPEKIDEATIENWLHRLMDMGAKRVAITSVNLDGDHYVYGFDEDQKIFRVSYRHIPIMMGGTGDVFSSLLIGKLQRKSSLKEAIEYATKILSDIIEKEYNRGIGDWAMEVEIQRYLQDIYKSL